MSGGLHAGSGLDDCPATGSETPETADLDLPSRRGARLGCSVAVLGAAHQPLRPSATASAAEDGPGTSARALALSGQAGSPPVGCAQVTLRLSATSLGAGFTDAGRQWSGGLGAGGGPRESRGGGASVTDGHGLPWTLAPAWGEL